MASAQSLTNMILAVRRRANIESQVGFISDAEITEYLNYCLSDLYDQLVQAGGQPWYRNSYTFTSVNNTSAYSLPTDFYRLVSVDIALGGGLVISARPYMEAERNRFRWYYQGWFAGRPVFYRLLGNQINFIPTPSGSYSITLNYYPTFAKLVSGSDTFDGVNGWEELAVWKAAAYCKAKGDEDPGYCEAQAAKLQERIDALAAQRDAENPERVHDVTVDLYPWY
jgi:hypothetical protein